MDGTMSMVARVARCLQESDDTIPKGAPLEPWALEGARAVMAVMRHPTAAMVDASRAGHVIYPQWRRMIDAARFEPVAMEHKITRQSSDLEHG